MGLARLAERHDAMRPVANLRGLLEVIRRRLVAGQGLDDVIAEVDAQISEALGVLRPPVGTQGQDEWPARVADSLEHICRQSGVLYQLDSDGSGSAVIKMSALLDRAMANLLTNAKEAVEDNARIQKDGITPQIHVLIRVRRHTVENGLPMILIRMENDGPVLTAQHMRELLTLGHSSKPGGHSGLGLSLAYVIIRDLGGKIRFSPRQEGGLRVEIWLPDLTDDPSQYTGIIP